ncbi:N-acylneuraminate cytidylyltransferase [Novosphingobium sp. CF614]|uniref:acylneuraminate cytidylyltransferase family protein n=1 Tax=Novosphingobium sp. CF614 TaxID=1884364 RepID=UPI0008E0253E|nr:acylneuraminate cytidylyltransferase family protein [Novosphingobium sp. CF614]SFG19848.1 N-acylneuraminate cytidylyltransferase [Novosphingobium sp. CF614]
MTGVCALVLARSGSKGLPGKNIRSLGGHPLIAWSIAAARASGAVDCVVCSTDCEQIAAIARSYGAETPFLRPAELASDNATDLDVFEHALSWLDDHGKSPDLIVQLRPTTPFRDPAWIDAAVERMRADLAITCVRSVTSAEPTPYKMWSLSHDGARLSPLLTVEGMSEPYNMPRQKLPLAYWHTGQLDVIRSDTIRAGSMTGTQIAPLHVDRDLAIDIDTLRDFQLAELAFDETMPAILRHVIAEPVGEAS